MDSNLNQLTEVSQGKEITTGVRRRSHQHEPPMATASAVPMQQAQTLLRRNSIFKQLVQLAYIVLLLAKVNQLQSSNFNMHYSFISV